MVADRTAHRECQLGNGHQHLVGCNECSIAVELHLGPAVWWPWSSTACTQLPTHKHASLCEDLYQLAFRGVHSIARWKQDASWKKMGGSKKITFWHKLGWDYSGGELLVQNPSIRGSHWGSLQHSPNPLAARTFDSYVRKMALSSSSNMSTYTVFTRSSFVCTYGQLNLRA